MMERQKKNTIELAAAEITNAIEEMEKDRSLKEMDESEENEALNEIDENEEHEALENKRSVKWLFRLKKLAVFALAFSFTCGIISVDNSYSELTGREGIIAPYAKRLDKDMVEFGILGNSREVNITELAEGYSQMEDTVADALDRFTKSTRNLLGLSDPETEQKAEQSDEQGRAAYLPTEIL